MHSADLDTEILPLSWRVGNSVGSPSSIPTSRRTTALDGTITLRAALEDLVRDPHPSFPAPRNSQSLCLTRVHLNASFANTAHATGYENADLLHDRWNLGSEDHIMT